MASVISRTNSLSEVLSTYKLRTVALTRDFRKSFFESLNAHLDEYRREILLGRDLALLSNMAAQAKRKRTDREIETAKKFAAASLFLDGRGGDSGPRRWHLPPPSPPPPRSQSLSTIDPNTQKPKTVGVFPSGEDSSVMIPQPLKVLGVTARLAALIVIATCWVQAACSQSAQTGGVEEIYLARSLRQSRSAPTLYCSEERAGFSGTMFEDQYTLQSIETRASDGLMTSAKVNTIGRLHACVGPTSDTLVVNFYAEGMLGAVSFKAGGDCRTAKPDYPEPGITMYACFFKLRDLPEAYVGGSLTTNTISSRQAIGETSDPSGYVQPSIATVRLWKRRS